MATTEMVYWVTLGFLLAYLQTALFYIGTYVSASQEDPKSLALLEASFYWKFKIAKFYSVRVTR